jgi:hypothetical protein
MLDESCFDYDRPPLTFSALGKPRGQSLGKLLGRELIACFKAAICNRQRIVELRRVREISHAELVQPLERAGSSFTFDHDVHLKLLRVHGISLAPWCCVGIRQT